MAASEQTREATAASPTAVAAAPTTIDDRVEGSSQGTRPWPQTVLVDYFIYRPRPRSDSDTANRHQPNHLATTTARVPSHLNQRQLAKFVLSLEASLSPGPRAWLRQNQDPENETPNPRPPTPRWCDLCSRNGTGGVSSERGGGVSSKVPVRVRESIEVESQTTRRVDGCANLK